MSLLYYTLRQCALSMQLIHLSYIFTLFSTSFLSSALPCCTCNPCASSLRLFRSYHVISLVSRSCIEKLTLLSTVYPLLPSPALPPTLERDALRKIDQIKAAPAALNHTYTILLCPHVTSVCASILEDLGVLGSVDIYEFPMALIPLERDLLSMELGSKAYKDVFLESNYDSIYELARGLLTLQRAFGVIPRLIGKGDAARVSLLFSSFFS